MGFTTRSGKDCETTPLQHGRLYRLHRAANMAKKVGRQRQVQKRKTRSTIYTTPQVLAEAITSERKRKKNDLPPPSKKTRSHGGPRCHGYGPYRVQMYPGFFFCSPCAQVDTETKDVNPQSRRFKCTAGHESFFFPTTEMKSPPSEDSDDEDSDEEVSDDEDDDSDDEDDIEDVTPLPCPPANLVEVASEAELENTALKRKIARLEKELLEAKGGAEKAARRKSNNVTSANKDFKDEITEVVEDFLKKKYKRMGRKRIGKLLAKAFFSLGDGVAKDELLTLAKKELRRTTFAPWRILRAMDLNGGTLNYAGVEILRSLESENEKYFHGSLIPSTAELQRVARQVESFGKQHAPWERVMKETGEGIEFKLETLIPTVLKAYGLEEVAKERPVVFAQSLDGTDITKNFGCIIGGLKPKDKMTICPITKKFIFALDPKDSTVQSRNNCIIASVYVGRETKKTWEYFRPNFEFMDNCTKEETNPFAHLGIKPMIVCTECDMSATWHGLCCGGAAKIAKTPCHCCAILSDQLHVPNATPCNRWCAEQQVLDPTWKCYHHPFLSESKIEELAEELVSITAHLSMSIEDITRKTSMSVKNPDEPTADCETRPSSIHFQPTTAAERQAFSNLLTKELLIRNLSDKALLTDLAERREALRDELRNELKTRDLIVQLKRSKPAENAFFTVINALPCILHCSNRCNLKLITLLLAEGLSHAKRKNILQDIKAEGNRVDSFIQKVEEIFNCEITGTREQPGQFVLPTQKPDGGKKTDTEIAIICMANDRTVKAIDKMETLINLCVPNEEVQPRRKMLWERCIPKYRNAMLKLRQHADFTDDDIAEFQNDFDLFFQDWVELYGKNGLTNYIHLLSSGHISEYLHKWKNLYAHSQQGWESLNNQFKTMWFRRTGRGGAANGGKGPKSKLIPMAKWLQRRIIWMCGFEWNEIASYVPPPDTPTDPIDDADPGLFPMDADDMMFATGADS
jgi:hypothetical protein